MATVVITFFLSVQFYVCKMDADYIESQRDQFLSRRKQRWSMNSQRLEEIVAEMMKPISDVRRSFDTDLSALLEEYLTEAGLHALDAEEEASDAVVPNFSELALLLQQSASIYGRKVDFLYQHVLNVSDSLHNSTQEATEPEPRATAALGARRKRKASTLEGFGDIELEPSAAAQREPDPPRPPPTLPRMYIELEPRVLTAADAPLRDYADEPIGLLSDFQVAWRLHEGYLVDELQQGQSSAGSALRPVSLLELQAAIQAAAPGEPPPAPASPAPGADDEPLGASTPLPTEGDSLLPPPVPLAKKSKKRRSDVGIADVFNGTIKMFIDDELLAELSVEREFSISGAWIAGVLLRRKRHILQHRRALVQPAPATGFLGWSTEEVELAKAAAKSTRLESESDDDGFFEQSSVGDSDASRTDEPASGAAQGGAGGAGGADWAAWQARVLQRADAAEAKGGVDVRELGARVLGELERAPQPAHVAHVLRAAREPPDVSRLLLATLFLANAGNVEIIQGPPLSIDSFSVRLMTRDERLYAAAAQHDEQFFR